MQIGSTTPNVTIYYTTDGSVPTTSSKVYSGAIQVGISETVRAFATASGYSPSVLRNATYTLLGGPFGTVEIARDSRTNSTTVAQSDDLYVSGWAIDPQVGAPVSQVEVLIDGSVAGSATLGVARPGIAALYPNIPNDLDSGWTFTLPASGLSIGTHTVTANAYSALRVGATLYKQLTITVATTSTGPPFGIVETATDLRTNSTTVAQSDSVYVTGFAIDPQVGAPVSKVQVLIDGNVAGNATLGIARPLTAALYPQVPNDVDSGWQFTMPASGLSLGTHTITAIASDSLNLSATLYQQLTITVATTSTGPPFGIVQEAYDSRTSSTTVAQSDSLLVTGFAIDPQVGAPVSKVQVLIDGNLAGNATLGISRPLTAALYPQVPNDVDCGWQFTMSASGLSLGTHTVTAVAYDALGLSATLYQQKTFTVSATSTGPPFGIVQDAYDSRTRSTTVSQSDNLLVAGFAIDPQQGAPVSEVQILVDGNAVGTATLGIADPSIAALYPQVPNDVDCGWTFTMPASGLSLGTHTVKAVAYDSLSLSGTLYHTWTIDVSP